jgi:hypothetical protein
VGPGRQTPRSVRSQKKAVDFFESWLNILHTSQVVLGRTQAVLKRRTVIGAPASEQRRAAADDFRTKVNEVHIKSPVG